MTVKQLEERVSRLENRIEAMVSHQVDKRDGWRALIGIGTDDPVMKEVMRFAQQYREENRRNTRPKAKGKRKTIS